MRTQRCIESVGCGFPKSAGLALGNSSGALEAGMRTHRKGGNAERTESAVWGAVGSHLSLSLSPRKLNQTKPNQTRRKLETPGKCGGGELRALEMAWKARAEVRSGQVYYSAEV